jgi:hypothetical protein
MKAITAKRLQQLEQMISSFIKNNPSELERYFGHGAKKALKAKTV